MSDNKKGIPSGVLALIIIIGSYVLMRYIARPPLPSNLTNFFMLFVFAGVLIHLTLDDRRIDEFLSFISLTSKQPLVWDIFRKAVIIIIHTFNNEVQQTGGMTPPA